MFSFLHTSGRFESPRGGSQGCDQT